MSVSIQIERFVPRIRAFAGREPLSFSIEKGESAGALIGPNGAGKTLVTDIIQGKLLPKEGVVAIKSDIDRPTYQLIKSISFRDIYSLADCREAYYQQRWNSFNVEESPIVRTLFDKIPADKVAYYVSLLHIEPLMEKRLIALSSGELRKFLIAKVLMHDPALLILDNPFIGLDAQSRQSLNELLKEMAQFKGLQILLVLSHPKDLPEWLDYVVPVKDRQCLEKQTPAKFLQNSELMIALFPEMNTETIVFPAANNVPHDTYEEAVRMEKVCVQYHEHRLLSNVDWVVKQGEKWALLGENGSGKSTLLSLICGDNPQAYANKITLFGRKRGSGESIWEIKKRIGYLSPDMHTYYLEDTSCINVVASGFFDSIGLFRKCNEEQKQLAAAWMRLFRCDHLADCSFVKISYGEQRLVLLARAFVKNPELLILDEPLHGLDAGKKELAKQIIEAFCEQKGKTLLYVTHYEDEIPSCVTQRKVLYKHKEE